MIPKDGEMIGNSPRFRPMKSRGFSSRLFLYRGLLLAGAAASAVVGLQHVMPLSLARRTRKVSIWAHVLLLWPLPALLGFHVLKTYWY